jgi:hypothetical protein
LSCPAAGLLGAAGFHELSHRVSPRVRGGAQPVNGSGPIRRTAVLTELVLGLDLSHPHLDPDDAAQLPVDIGRRGVLDPPAVLAVPFVLIGQAGNDVPEPAGVPVEGHRPGEMNGGVVPGRNDATML